MALDYRKYSEAFDRFLAQMMSMVGRDDRKYDIGELCVMLRAGRLDVHFYEDLEKEHENISEDEIYYDSGNADTRDPMIVREVSKKGHIAVYRIFPVKNEEPWTAEEKSKLTIIAKTLFAFNARERLIKFADYAMNYDREMKIPNMNFFRRRLSELMSRHEISDYGVCFFNLKRFSSINKRIGRGLGTRVMVSFIAGLQNALGDDGCVCRLGGDNFVMCFRKERLDFVMGYLNGTAVSYGENADEKVRVTATAGYYMIPEHSTDIGEILENGLLASQSARQDPTKTHMFFDNSLQHKRENDARVESLFFHALEKEEFLVYYQPKVRLRNYTLAGAEALCRWKHGGELIPPFRFIPVLEQSQAICRLDFYMLEHVCMDIRRWLDTGQKAVRVSVNLSRRHMGDPQLLENIISVIDKYGVPHNLIEIELTETTTDIEFNDLKQIVSGLHDAGIHTSVDDFGVGYSSLNLIRQVPWDVIKIDKSFLPDSLNQNSTQYIMFSHLLSMLRDMGLKCIVEGVETIQQVKMLKENNCYLAQGFYFDKPLEISEFEKRLSALQ